MLGHRFTGHEAVAGRIAERTCRPEELVTSCKTFGRNVIKRGAYSRDSLRNMKSDVYQSVKVVIDKHSNTPMAGSHEL